MFREPHPGIVTMSLRLLVASVFLTFWVVLAVPAMAQAPSPEAPPVLIDPLDPRAGDETVSPVGAPLLAVLVVVASGTLVAAGTVAYVKLSRRRGAER